MHFSDYSDDYYSDFDETLLDDTSSSDSTEKGDFFDDDYFENLNQRYEALLEIERYQFFKEHQIFLKHPLSITCGIKRKRRSCFLNATLQIFARLNESIINSSNYSDYFREMKDSDCAIKTDIHLLKKMKMEFPNEENAINIVDYLIDELFIEKMTEKKYSISYFDKLNEKTEKIEYMMKTAIDKQLIIGNPIQSFEIFQASLLSQIGLNYSVENILDVYPPPIIFIEIWNFNKDTRNIEFDNFCINVMGKDYEYICIGALIHITDHFKTVAFDFGHKILLDDAIVANLSIEDEECNLFKQNELQELQTNIKMIVFQIKNEQFDEYSSLEIQ